MKRSKYFEEQIVYALRQAESGTPSGMSAANSAWPSKPSRPGRSRMPIWGVSELRRLRQLEEENSRLKQLVAGLSLDKHMLTETLRKTV